MDQAQRLVLAIRAQVAEIRAREANEALLIAMGEDNPVGVDAIVRWAGCTREEYEEALAAALAE